MSLNQNRATQILGTVYAFRTQVGTLLGLLIVAAFVIISIFQDPTEMRWFVPFVVASLITICSWMIGERMTAASQVVQAAAPQLVDAVRGAVREGLAHEGPEFLENEQRVLEKAITVIELVKQGRGPHSPEQRVRATSLFMSSDPRAHIQEIKSKYFEAVANLCKSGNYRYQVVMTTKERDKLQDEIGVRTKAFDLKYGKEVWKLGTEFDPRYVGDQSGLEVLLIADHVLLNIMRTPGDRPQRAGVYMRNDKIAEALRQWYDETLVPNTEATIRPESI